MTLHMKKIPNYTSAGMYGNFCNLRNYGTVFLWRYKVQ